MYDADERELMQVAQDIWQKLVIWGGRGTIHPDRGLTVGRGYGGDVYRGASIQSTTNGMGVVTQ